MLHYAPCSIAIFDSWDVHCKANFRTLEPGDSDKISVDPRDLCRQAADGSRWQQMAAELVLYLFTEFNLFRCVSSHTALRWVGPTST